jgi:hypothetical protein
MIILKNAVLFALARVDTDTDVPLVVFVLIAHISFFLPFLVRLLLPIHFRCKGLLLHCITFRNTHTHTHTHTHTLGRTPVDEGSALRRGLYLTTHDTHKRQISMSPAGFEPEIPASKQPPTHALDRLATGIGAELSKDAKYGRQSYFWLITVFIYVLFI